MFSFFSSLPLVLRAARHFLSLAMPIAVVFLSIRGCVVSLDQFPYDVPVVPMQSSSGDGGLDAGQTPAQDAVVPQLGDAGLDGGAPDAGRSSGQVPVDARHRRLQLALARICVSEAGFQLRTRDCEFIYHVLRTRGRTGELELGTMRAYCKKSFNRLRTDDRRWVAHLTHTFTEPRGWRETTTLHWDRRRRSFQEVYEFAGRIIIERPDNPCELRLDHWGARGFRHRLLLRRGWRTVECGPTLNTFWSIPRRSNRPDAGVN